MAAAVGAVGTSNSGPSAAGALCTGTATGVLDDGKAPGVLDDGNGTQGSRTITIRGR